MLKLHSISCNTTAPTDYEVPVRGKQATLLFISSEKNLMKAEERSGEINSVKSCICGTIGVCMPPCNAAVLFIL